MTARERKGHNSQTDDRRDRTLPVTQEVGSEGGSYADPTFQVATFGGHDAPPLAEGGRPPATSGEAIDRAQVAAQGVGAAPGPESGMVRYPTEPPQSPSVPRAGRASRRWTSAVIGAAAGAAAALLLRSRRH